MILYNLRYRGPYEYDKFVLNIFQFHNDVQDMIKLINDGDKSTMNEFNDKIDTLLEKSTNMDLLISLEKEGLR
jgi:hypothetical protein